VYFADLAGKSSNYCCTHLSKGVGLFVVCEVALGKCQELKRPNCDADILPPGINSTHAIGYRRPDPNESITISKDVEVPCGKIQNYSEGGMGANEFVVYNTNQIKMRYIV